MKCNLDGFRKFEAGSSIGTMGKAIISDKEDLEACSNAISMAMALEDHYAKGYICPVKISRKE